MSLKIRTLLHAGEEWTVPINADELQLTHAIFGADSEGMPILAGWHSRIAAVDFLASTGTSVPAWEWTHPVELIEIHPDLDPFQQQRAA